MNRHGAILVLSVFALIWWMFGAAQLGRGSAMLYAVGIVISGLLVVFDRLRGGRSATHEERKHRGRTLRIASAVEGAAILAAVIVLNKIGRRDLIAPAIAIIVGLHFLPIARGLRASIYYLTAALLVAVGVAGAFVPDLPVRIAAVCMGAAAVLWLSCGMILVRAGRLRSQAVGEKV